MAAVNWCQVHCGLWIQWQWGTFTFLIFYVLLIHADWGIAPTPVVPAFIHFQYVNTFSGAMFFITVVNREHNICCAVLTLMQWLMLNVDRMCLVHSVGCGRRCLRRPHGLRRSLHHHRHPTPQAAVLQHTPAPPFLLPLLLLLQLHPHLHPCQAPLDRHQVRSISHAT